MRCGEEEDEKEKRNETISNQERKGGRKWWEKWTWRSRRRKEWGIKIQGEKRQEEDEKKNGMIDELEEGLEGGIKDEE